MRAKKAPLSSAEVHTVILYRPVGPAELALIRESGWKSFPPRLPEQPIFYPVTNAGYAAQIAPPVNGAPGEIARGGRRSASASLRPALRASYFAGRRSSRTRLVVCREFELTR